MSISISIYLHKCVCATHVYIRSIEINAGLQFLRSTSGEYTCVVHVASAATYMSKPQQGPNNDTESG